jgi:hypothetical protein
LQIKIKVSKKTSLPDTVCVNIGLASAWRKANSIQDRESPFTLLRWKVEGILKSFTPRDASRSIYPGTNHIWIKWHNVRYWGGISRVFTTHALCGVIWGEKTRFSATVRKVTILIILYKRG